MIIFCITIIALFCVLAGYCGHTYRSAGRARLDLQRHADAGTTVNATGGFVNAYTGETEGFTSTHSFSVGMKTYYDTELLENAREELVHAQFGRRQTLPANKGKTVEWRKWNTLPKALRPLTEGVIPNGQKFGETSITTGISQHGMYIAITDLLDTHNVDNVLLGATEELGASAGGTEDTLVRNELLKGTNVTYCDVIDDAGNVKYTPNYRYELQADNCRLTPQMVHKVSTKLTKLKAPKINGDYVAIIHPSVSFDLIEDPKWEEFHKYASTTEIYKREIGKLYGVKEARQGVGRESGKPWVSQDFELLIKNRNKEEVIVLNAWGATCDQLAKIEIGQLVKVELVVHGDEYNGKRYNRLEASFIDAI